MKGPVRTFACPWPGSGSGEASVRRCLLLTSADAAGGQDAGDDGGGEGVLGVRRTRPKKPQEPGQTPQAAARKDLCRRRRVLRPPPRAQNINIKAMRKVIKLVKLKRKMKQIKGLMGKVRSYSWQPRPFILRTCRSPRAPSA
eukprot:688378-Prorocentrum_minimum.AAC.2